MSVQHLQGGRTFVLNRSNKSRGFWLLVFIFLAIVLQNSYELNLIMQYGKLDLLNYEGPIYFKVLKDVCYLYLFMSALAFRSLRPSAATLRIFMLVCLCIALLASISLILNGYFTALIGLRWSLPFLLFFLLENWTNRVSRAVIVFWISLGAIVCLLLQFYQLFYMPPIFGELEWGYSARTPGVFVAPNSAAFFGCVSAAVLMQVSNAGKLINICFVILSIAISSLAQSGAGILASLALFLLLFQQRPGTLMLLLVVVSVGVLLPYLDIITKRADYLELSGGGRLSVLFKIIGDSGLSLGNFGVYTNASNLQIVNVEDKLVPDSLIASFIGNVGILSPVVIGLTIYFVRSQMKTVNWKAAMPCLVVFAMFSMTTIVFEAFPMNLYLIFGIWSANMEKFRLVSSKKASYGYKAQTHGPTTFDRNTHT